MLDNLLRFQLNTILTTVQRLSAGHAMLCFALLTYLLLFAPVRVDFRHGQRAHVFESQLRNVQEHSSKSYIAGWKSNSGDAQQESATVKLTLDRINCR